MSSKVMRYDPINSDGTCGMCVEDADYGAYVEYADYAALEAECERLRQQVAALSAQQSAHVSVPRELLEKVCDPKSSTNHQEGRKSIRTLLNGGEA